MRVSDWNSDVCPADLVAGRQRAVDDRRPQPGGLLHAGLGVMAEVAEAAGEVQVVGGVPGQLAVGGGFLEVLVLPVVEVDVADRSEEHTSELQSLMRISYAVFCLKKKT